MGLALSVQLTHNGQESSLQFDSDSHRTIKIGRLPSAQLRLDDAKAARIHAVIELSGTAVSLVDMGSTQGTLVNGVKAHKVKLNSGDQILIGDTQLTVTIGDAPIQAATPQAEGAAAAPVQIVAPAAAMPGAAASPMAPALAVDGTSQSTMPRFEGSNARQEIRRITRDRLEAAGVEAKPHPALPPEQAVSDNNRVLELRVYWGEVLLAMHHYSSPKKITIGETKRTDVFISSEGLPIEEFPLVRGDSGDYVLTFTSHMDGELEVGGEAHELTSVRGSSLVRKDPDLDESYQVTLPTDARAIIHWGGATFALRFVSPPQPIPRTFLQNVDLQYVQMLLLSVFFHVAMVATMVVYPPDSEALRTDLFGEPDRWANLILEAPKKTESNKKMLEKLKKKQKEQRDKMAKKRPKPDKNLLTTRVNRPTKKTAQQKKAEVAQKFSKLFEGSGGSGSLLGGGGGGTLSGTLSNVIGTTGKGSGALAGLGIRGTGPLTGGGIGTSRGVAGIGTSGRAGGGGLGYGSNVGLGKRRDRGMISLSTPVVMGALPKEVIQKVINQNKAQIRYCYEVELQRNQNLSGKVAMKWIISATGSVAKAVVAESTLGSASVERCIRAKIKTWKFPAPAGGGIVEVNYPFVFKAS